MPTPLVQDMKISKGCITAWFWDGHCLIIYYKVSNKEPQSLLLVRGGIVIEECGFRWWDNIFAKKRGEAALIVMQPYFDATHSWIRAHSRTIGR